MNFRMSRINPFGVLIEPLRSAADISSIDIETLRNLFRKEHLIALRGFAEFSNTDEFTSYCERWGEISVWPFGKVLELVEHKNPTDHIFDNNYVPLHWDGMYRPQVPEYQIFRCVSAPLQGQGGRTTFSNTVSALQNAPVENRNIWGKVTGVYKRKMEFYDSKTVSAVITAHPHSGKLVIRYNEPPSAQRGKFLNPPDLEFKGIDPKELELFHQTIQKALYSPENYYAHEWQTGDLVIADNFSLLHGREKFVSQAPRHLQRVHVLSNPPLDNPGLESYR